MILQYFFEGVMDGILKTILAYKSKNNRMTPCYQKYQEIEDDDDDDY